MYLDVFSLPFIDLIDRADDRRHKIIIKMETTVKIVPPITAESIMIKGRLSTKIFEMIIVDIKIQVLSKIYLLSFFKVI